MFVCGQPLPVFSGHRTWLDSLRLLHMLRFPHLPVKMSFYTGTTFTLMSTEEGVREKGEENRYLLSTYCQPRYFTHIVFITLFQQLVRKSTPVPKYKWRKGGHWNSGISYHQHLKMTIRTTYLSGILFSSICYRTFSPLTPGLMFSKVPASSDQQTLEHSHWARNMQSSNFQAPRTKNKPMYICVSKSVAYNEYHFVVINDAKPLSHGDRNWVLPLWLNHTYVSHLRHQQNIFNYFLQD